MVFQDFKRSFRIPGWSFRILDLSFVRIMDLKKEKKKLTDIGFWIFLDIGYWWFFRILKMILVFSGYWDD